MTEIDIGYIYVIKEREFIKTNEQIYKIGKTAQLNFKRFSQYSKGSKILYYQKTNKHSEAENVIINNLRGIFKRRKDIGNEYFECNLVDMLLEVIKAIRGDNFSGKYVDESKKELQEFYEKQQSNLPSKDDLFDNFFKLIKDEMTEEEYEKCLTDNNRQHLTSHQAINDVILASILEMYCSLDYIIKSKQLSGKPDKDRYMILSRYNAFKYIINCVKHDPERGDYYNKENRKYMKIAGEFLNKEGGINNMSNFLHCYIPKIFHRDVDNIWDGIGDWKA